MVRVHEVTDAAAVATRFQSDPFPARLDVFEYLLDHPEFATHVTRTLRLARYRVWQTADGLFLDDGWGARGRLEVVHAGTGVRVIYARGDFEQRFLPTIPGEAVVVIEYAPSEARDGRQQISTAVSGFVKIDNRMYAAATKLAGSIALRRARLEAERLARVFARTSLAIESDPAGVYERVRQNPTVPKRELGEFRRILNLP